eukprot:Tbor_TRINITY_DN4980_c0_g1::TRINITY_DN4980_c0_g1_i1::g.10000::m.10000
MRFAFQLPITLVLVIGMGHVASDVSASRIFPTSASLPPSRLRDVNMAIAEIHNKNPFATNSTGGENHIDCEKCKKYVDILKYLGEHTTMLAITVKMVEDYCWLRMNASEAALCKTVGSLALKYLPKLVQLMNFEDWTPMTVCAILFDTCSAPCCEYPLVPEQIHLSLGDSEDFSIMTVTWVTLNEDPTQQVTYGETSMSSTAIATSRIDTKGGWIGTIYTATMTGLKPNTMYTYKVGSPKNGFSQIFSFTTFPTNIGTPGRPLRILNVGDMGYNHLSDYTVSQMIKMVARGEVDMMIHNGDIGYADGMMAHWDMFFNKVQNIAAYIPYMTTPGNHELLYNFSAYRSRVGLSMPRAEGESPEAMFYKLKIGPATILMLDAETWIDTANIPPLEQRWIAKQLSEVNRSVTPWILAFQHRPLYCLSDEMMDCVIFADLLREQIEETYLKYKVDLIGTAHVHRYLRSYPVAENKIMSWNYMNYTNPPAPIHVLNGAAGNREMAEKHPNNSDPLFPADTWDIGYGLIHIESNVYTKENRLRYQYFRSSDNKVMDDFTIMKRI